MIDELGKELFVAAGADSGNENNHNVLLELRAVTNANRLYGIAFDA